MDFSSWSSVNEYNSKAEKPLFTKTELSRQGLKPKKDVQGESHRVRYDRRWNYYEFFTLDQAEPKRTVHKILSDYECNSHNLCEALYIINKSSKISRDTKVAAYYQGNHGVCSRAKTRAQNLYTLKNRVINKMKQEQMIDLAGYHMQRVDDRVNHLLLYKSKDNDFSFHVPTSIAPKDIACLGEISERITAEKTKATGIKYSDAVNLLQKYVK